jgi:hypothetical protein
MSGPNRPRGGRVGGACVTMRTEARGCGAVTHLCHDAARTEPIAIRHVVRVGRRVQAHEMECSGTAVAVHETSAGRDSTAGGAVVFI